VKKHSDTSCYKTFRSYSHTRFCKWELNISKAGMLRKKPKIVAQVKGAKLQIWRTILSGIHHVAFQTSSTGCSSTLWCSTLTHTSLTILDINIKSHGQMYAHRTHSKSGSKSYRTDCYIIPSCKLQLVNPFSKSQYTKVLTLNKRSILHLLHLNILSMQFKTLQNSSIKVVYHKTVTKNQTFHCTEICTYFILLLRCNGKIYFLCISISITSFLNGLFAPQWTCTTIALVNPVIWI